MPGSGIVGKEMKYNLTEEQNALAGRIRLMKTMFTDSDACDTIAMESMALVKSMEKELVKSLHRNAIIPPGADKFWRTTIYVKGENGSLIRRNLRASTEEKLYGKLYNHYVGPGTLEQMYELWARYRKDHENLAAATTLREKQRWDKYFGGSDEFIRKAFEYAREADPDALLFYNDYNECDPVKCDRICTMIRSMKADGVPIDGIGMQGHYNIYGPSEADIENAVSRYADIVDHIHMTELDIRVNREMGGQLQHSDNAGATLTDTLLRRQQAQYAAVFRVMRRHADKVDCVTFWNLSDRDSWLGPDNYPLLFDRNYQPKPVYHTVRDFE